MWNNNNACIYAFCIFIAPKSCLEKSKITYLAHHVNKLYLRKQYFWNLTRCHPLFLLFMIKGTFYIFILYRQFTCYQGFKSVLFFEFLVDVYFKNSWFNILEMRRSKLFFFFLSFSYFFFTMKLSLQFWDAEWRAGLTSKHSWFELENNELDRQGNVLSVISLYYDLSCL